MPVVMNFWQKPHTSMLDTLRDYKSSLKILSSLFSSTVYKRRLKVRWKPWVRISLVNCKYAILIRKMIDLGTLHLFCSLLSGFPSPALKAAVSLGSVFLLWGQTWKTLVSCWNLSCSMLSCDYNLLSGESLKNVKLTSCLSLLPSFLENL